MNKYLLHPATSSWISADQLYAGYV